MQRRFARSAERVFTGRTGIHARSAWQVQVRWHGSRGGSPPFDLVIASTETCARKCRAGTQQQPPDTANLRRARIAGAQPILEVPGRAETPWTPWVPHTSWSPCTPRAPKTPQTPWTLPTQRTPLRWHIDALRIVDAPQTPHGCPTPWGAYWAPHGRLVDISRTPPTLAVTPRPLHDRERYLEPSPFI